MTSSPGLERRDGDDGAVAAAPARQSPVPVVPAVLGVLAVGATVAAALAASRVPLPVDSDLGLVVRLPVAYWVGPIVLNLVFAIGLPAAQRRSWLMPLLLACLVVTLYAPAALASGAPRAEVTWRHIGVMDAIFSSGTIDPGIDAYFNWPGFFALLGVVLQAAGLPPWGLALWAPVGTMVAWLVALAVVVRALSPDRRVLWLTLWLFALGNWIDQDYLSPQGFAYFLYLVVLGVLLTWLRSEPELRLRAELAATGVRSGLRRWWTSRHPLEPDARRRGAGVLVSVLLGAAMVVSHQLTPFALILAVALLVLTGRCWSTRLPVILVVIAGLWLAYGARGYLSGHPPVIAAGNAVASVQAGLLQRLTGGSEHLIVNFVRIGLTGTIWILAAIGALRWLARRRDIRPVLLAAAPFLLIPTQSYGGELLLRVTLFALPFTAFLAANAILGERGAQRRVGPLTVVGVTLLGVVLAAGMLTARFGNARFDVFTPAELEATQMMYALAPPDATMVAGGHPTAWRYQDYTRKYTTLQDMCDPTDSAARCLSRIEGRISHYGHGGVVMLTRSNRESLRLQGQMTPEDFDQFERLLSTRPGVVLAYQNADARIYLVPAPKVRS